MNTLQNLRQCAVCEESELSFIHIVTKNGCFQSLCPDCLLKDHREYYCPLCLIYFPNLPPPHDRKICQHCQSIAHLAFYRPPPSSSAASSSHTPASFYTCPLCAVPDLSFFPKSCAARSDQSGMDVGDDSGTPIDLNSLIIAAKISTALLKSSTDQLSTEAIMKIVDARKARLRAKDGLMNRQDFVIRQNASEESDDSRKRKLDDR